MNSHPSVLELDDVLGVWAFRAAVRAREVSIPLLAHG
jgi:hypothetical protein